MASPQTPEIGAESLLTSYQVGALLQVNPSSVNKWVKDGRIPAFRTPGGHRRIRAADLVAFLTHHKMPVPPALQQASRRRLLVADEDPRHLEAIAQGLKAYGDRLDLQLVSSGVDALVQVGAFRPHLVIIGMRMPGVDGLEVCRRLRVSPETRGIQVAIVANEISPDIERQATAAGAKLCVRRPMDVQLIVRELGLTASAG